MSDDRLDGLCDCAAIFKADSLEGSTALLDGKADGLKSWGRFLFGLGLAVLIAGVLMDHRLAIMIARLFLSDASILNVEASENLVLVLSDLRQVVSLLVRENLVGRNVRLSLDAQGTSRIRRSSVGILLSS